MLQQLVWTTGGLLSVFLSLSSSLSCLITSCSFHTFLSLSLCVIFSWILFSLPSTPSPLPLCGLSLISCATLASVFFKQLVFSWTPTSNIHFKRTETISCLKKKKKEAPESYLPSTATLPPPLPLSIQPSIRPSPSKMLFVYHHWSILAPGCCISISRLTSTNKYVCVRMRVERCCWFVCDFTGNSFISVADPRSQLMAVDNGSLTARQHGGTHNISYLNIFVHRTNFKGFTSLSRRLIPPSIHSPVPPSLPPCFCSLPL